MKLMIDIDAVGWNDVVMGYMSGSKALLMGVSAEEVIPCKDCKYWNKIDKAMYCTRHISIMHMDADDFCSRGEKKDE